MNRTSATLIALEARHAPRLFLSTALALGAVLVSGAATPATAATLCVHVGRPGCYSAISTAVAAAMPGDTISVAPGTYKESVGITKPLSLTGSNKENTIIDATGLLSGITITGTRDVLVSGLTVENANAAGIWITGSSFVTISDNRVLDNDNSLTSGSCPALAGTPFASNEAADCGEGIFLSAVDHSILANNTVTGNAGGMLITDDTGPTHDNLISNNSVVRNTALDCGITLPSHSDAGVYHNTISGNDSSYNGGPGVGIFAPGPGSKAYANVVINNRLRGNGLPGVTMHNHAAPGVAGVPGFLPQPNFNDNLIVGNDISANAQDSDDAATTGPTGINVYSVAPMSGTVIAQNVITEESLEVVINIPAITGAAAQIHLNDFQGRHVGVQDVTGVQVDATQNWWGCANGPNSNGCSTVLGSGVAFAPWLTNPFQSQ